MFLPKGEHVGMPGGELADVNGIQPKKGSGRNLTLREEAIGDAALIEDFDVRHANPRRAAGELLGDAPLNDG